MEIEDQQLSIIYFITHWASHETFEYDDNKQVHKNIYNNNDDYMD